MIRVITFKNKTANAIKVAKCKAYDRIINDSQASIWNKINLLRGVNRHKSTTIKQLITEEKVSQQPNDISNCLNKYFASVGSKLNNTFPALPNQSSLITHTGGFDFNEVTNDTVTKLVLNLQNRKSGGTEQIPSFIYKLILPLIAAPLTYIFNISLKCSIFPDRWKRALVIPLYKNGPHNLPGNYRPISLLPILGKVFEGVISHQIQVFVDTSNLLYSRQFGFRKGASCEQIIFQLVNTIKNMLHSKTTRCVTIASLDIKKAFDCVNHHLLCQKLNNNFLFNPMAVKLISNYLSDRVQNLSVNCYVSSEEHVSTGVPQGSVLGPLLFLLFINDLMLVDKNIYLFADDCLIMSHGGNPQESSDNLRNKLASAEVWYSNNLLVLNAAKTSIMTITKKKIYDLPKVNFNNISIKQVDKIKYLGFIIDSRLNFIHHVNNVKSKIYPLLDCFARKRKYCSAHTAAMWYKSILRPNLEYCSSILFSSGNTNLKTITKIENRCLKIINISDTKDNTRLLHNIPSIALRFKYTYLIQFYKLYHGLVPVIDDALVPVKSVSDRTRFGVTDGVLLGSGAPGTIHNFGAKLFNELPSRIRAINDLESFKINLRNYLFP